ncbi:MAG: hypothetical protein Q8N23_12230 [Archangium sp.]|nr:hypothetical protein [Archangium sp.]
MRNLIGTVVVGVSLFAGVAAAEVYVQVNVPVPVVRVVAPAPRVVVYKPGHRKHVRIVDNRGPGNNKGNNGKHRR